MLSLECVESKPTCIELDGPQSAALGAAIAGITGSNQLCLDVRDHLEDISSTIGVYSYPPDEAWAWADTPGSRITINHSTFNQSHENLVYMLIHEARHNVHGDNHPMTSPNDDEAYTLCASAY
jgi:hypothetical protein